ncbi:nucleotidyltransferase domain-containing protein [Propionivibrio sp.]|uniref:nucleotidyltransferase domain-containing protein n=1 Tax=Propionivibrio sp. TaxID=2212460 RepID=UPI0026139332|nr:nucleotidyltransferase domain-containing protein [Propionivibrio sp.]
MTAQTAFSQVVEVTLSAEHMRSVADLPGAFVPKSVKGHKYWYYQYTEPAGVRRQIFVGPDSDAVQSLMTKATEHAAGASLGPLVRSAAVLGCAEIFPRHFRVLRRLAEYGFFKAGGVLVGTHAFVAYGNMLGVRWDAAGAARTQDIDFAHAGKRISLLLAANSQVQTHEAIESLAMGFLPIAGLSGKTGGAYLIPSEKDFRLDFLSTVGRSGNEPYEHPDLHITLQPLRFMEYSLENVQQTALLSGASATMVNVPHPARYALHKLIVYGEREGAFRSKSNKDLVQAGLLLAALQESRPWEVDEAWVDLLARGDGWVRRAQYGLAALCQQFPEEKFGDWLKIGKKKASTTTGS